MLGKRSRPSVRRLPEIITPTDRAASSDIMLSPPTGSRIISPNGWKNPDLGGVGLAIVAALDKPSSDNSEIKAKFFVGSLNLSRSDPIPIGSVKNRVRFRGGFDESECSENFTFVTSRLSDKATSTRVYYGASERGGEFHHHGGEFDSRFRKMGMFFASPPTSSEPFPALPTADFLSSCYLCRKKLHGKDIYMYRGEKAFCSTECRSRQIVSDERKEKCGSEASKSSDYSIYSESRFLSPGVVAA